jgi:hypothetical protein
MQKLSLVIGLVVLAKIMTVSTEAGVLTVSGLSANGKTYDGTVGTTVNFGGAILNGVNSGDVGNVSLVTNGYTANFSDKNAGVGKSVVVSGLTLTGSAATNYTLTQPVLSATIAPLSLTVTAAGLNKNYDSTANASANLSDNKISGDDVEDYYDSASFADKNVGTNKTVTVSDIFIIGTDSDNYDLANTTATTTANIASKTLRVAATGQNKPYDGTTAATVTLLDNHYSGDAVTDSYASAQFADQYVDDGITINVSGISISGTDAHNYVLNTTTAHTQANITPRPLNVTATGQNKTYDGTTNATVTLTNDCLSGDEITVSFDSAAFSDKNVGTNKTVSVYNIVITGPDSDSYEPASNVVTTVANISSRGLTIVATATNKIYDGTASAGALLSDNRISGDNLTDVYGSASFGDKNVGSGKTVSVSGISVTGPDAMNYAVGNTTASTPANITARSLTVTAAGQDKAYDGTVNATVTLSDNRVSGDALTNTYSSASFADKSVGTGKTITVTGIQTTGPDAANYSLGNTTATATANITGYSLSVAATGQNKVYDGTTNASVTLSDNRLSGAAITVNYSGAGFNDKNVGNGKTLNVTGLSIGGTDAGNYTLASTNISTTANITARGLTVTAVGQSKAYDGTVNATVTLSDNRVSGDALTNTYSSASFADKSVGTGKTITVIGIQTTGPDAANYSLGNTTATATANITGYSLSVAATGQNKVYDGTTNASVTLSDNRLAGAVITVNYIGAGFNDKNVGNGKTLNVTGLSIGGTDAGNYTLASTNISTTANITACGLTVTATGQNKAYDGTVNATVTLSDNRISGDVLTNTYSSASFADKNAGTGKTITVTGIQTTGPDAANYTLATATATATANITGYPLSVAAIGQNKVYDGTTNASVTFSDNQLGGDVITVACTNASFSDKRVGSGKTVIVSGISISGLNAANYTLVDTNTSTTASITARPLTVTASGINKVYDGTTVATVTLADNRVANDSFSDSYGSASFATSSVGTGKTVNVSDIYIAGTDAGNYALGNTTASTTANITAGTTLAALTSSENPSGFHDLIAFTETLPADATGTVSYFTNGVAFTSGSLNAGVVTSGSLTNLVRGTNVITAIYSGDGNYLGATNSLSQVVTNHPPQTGYFTFSVTNGISLKLKLSSLLSACIDVDGDPISLVGVSSSTNGMPIFTNSTLLLFQNTNLVNDQFSYTVTDGQGGYATGQVAVVSVLAPFSGQNASLTPAGGTNYLTCYGIPGYKYEIQRSVNFLTWVNIATNTAAFNGTIPVIDRFKDLGGPPASAFYRLLWVP